MLIILLSLFFSTAQPTHEFYLGLVELNQNDQTGHFELSIRLFTDDLEAALRNDAGLPLNLGTETEVASASDHIQAYLNKHFELKVDGEAVSLNFLGGEVEDDAHWFFIESAEKFSTSGEITVYCSFLTEVYQEQKNVLQLNIGELSTREVFTTDRQMETFNF